MKKIMLILLLAAPAAAVTQHKVSQKEHLWGLARHYYGNPFLWRTIAEANPSVKNPHWIYPGQVLLIPDMPRQQAPAVVEASAPIPVEAARPAEPIVDEPAPAAEIPAEQIAAQQVPVKAPAPTLAPQPAQTLSEEGLSLEMPKALSGQYPSMTRIKAPSDWHEDGVVTEFEGREALAAEGDFISGLFKKSEVSLGEKLYVLRHEAPEDSDEDKKARYLMRVGEVVVRRDLGKGSYRLLILRSGDSIQAGDLLSKEKL